MGRMRPCLKLTHTENPGILSYQINLQMPLPHFSSSGKQARLLDLQQRSDSYIGMSLAASHQHTVGVLWCSTVLQSHTAMTDRVRALQEGRWREDPINYEREL